MKSVNRKIIEVTTRIADEVDKANEAMIQKEYALASYFHQKIASSYRELDDLYIERDQTEQVANIFISHRIDFKVFQ